MANEITEVPTSVSSAGHSFNYAVWTAGTVLTLVNATWDSTYRDVPKPGFNLDGWITAQSHKLTVSQSKHARLGAPVKVDVPFEVASQYNYIRATNPAQPVAGSLPSTYYYFIQSVDYGAPNTTILNVQLDVWATFASHVTFGRAYVQRSHLGIANENQFDQNGRYYLTVPEGLDTGGEMLIRKKYTKSLAAARSQGGSQWDSGFDIMITSTADLEQEPTDDMEIITAKGNQMENLPHGGSIYIFKDIGAFTIFMTNNRRKSWLTQSITSITAIPETELFNIPTTQVQLVGTDPGTSPAWKPTMGTIPNLEFDLATDWTTDVPLPARYAKLKKFNVYPYTAIEVTMHNGQPLMLKPEQMINRKLSMAALLHLAPGNGRLTILPQNYNAAEAGAWNDTDGEIADFGEWLDFATSISNFPQYSTVNNSFASFMQTNKNQIAFQQESARWDQTRALAGADTAAANAAAGMQNTESQGMYQQNYNQNMLHANTTQRVNQGLLDVGGSLSGGLQSAGAGNVAGGALSAATGMGISTGATMNDVSQMSSQALYANQQIGGSTGANLRAQGKVMDTNLSFANMAARGDYANQIAGIDARVQDMKMLQPTTSGQIGGESFNLAKTGWRVWAHVKTISEQVRWIIGEYWLRYGYQIHAWYNLPADLMVMDKFTYWQTLETTVRSVACPEEYRMTIRGILEKGVTVWDNPDDIGTLDPAANNPKPGVSY